jgi:hypothetical protein
VSFLEKGDTKMTNVTNARFFFYVALALVAMVIV